MLPRSSDDVFYLAYSADGTQLATAGKVHGVKLWDASSGRELYSLSGPTGDVMHLAFSPDGHVLATAGWDKTIKLWNASQDSGDRSQKSEGRSRKSEVRDATTDVRPLTSDLRVPASGALLFTLEGHIGAVASVAFSPNSQRLGFGELGPNGQVVGCPNRQRAALLAEAFGSCHQRDVQSRRQSTGFHEPGGRQDLGRRAMSEQRSCPLFEHLRAELDDIRAKGLAKQERQLKGPQGSAILVGGREVINFCANNYLGLANHPAIVLAAMEGLRTHGYGMASVRFICGTQDAHKNLEAAIARFLGKDDAILYSSCWDANGGLFETILGAEDTVLSDELNHASIIDGIRLCKAKRYRYKNCDMADLEKGLQEAAASRFRLIATDGVFSMDGLLAPLPDICALADCYDALVMVDDSHATGMMGPGGRGTAEHLDVLARIDIITSTLGKTLGGAAGGFTCAPPPRWSRNAAAAAPSPTSFRTPCRRRSFWPPPRPWSWWQPAPPSGTSCTPMPENSVPVWKRRASP